MGYSQPLETTQEKQLKALRLYSLLWQIQTCFTGSGISHPDACALL